MSTTLTTCTFFLLQTNVPFLTQTQYYFFINFKDECLSMEC